MEEKENRIARRVMMAASIEEDRPHRDRWVDPFEDEEDGIGGEAFLSSIDIMHDLGENVEKIYNFIKSGNEGPLELARQLESKAIEYNDLAERIRDVCGRIESSKVVSLAEDGIVQFGSDDEIRINVEAVDSIYEIACDEFDRVMEERDADREEYIAELKGDFDGKEAEFRKRRHDDPEGYGEDDMNNDIEKARNEMEEAIETANGDEREKDKDDAVSAGYDKVSGIFYSEVEKIGEKWN